MGGVLDYSTTAGSNTTVGGVSIAEGMQPGGVNNAMRAQMADVRKWQIDTSGVTTTAGAGNTYTFASQQGVTTYATGMRFCFEADKTNSGAATFNVDSTGAKALKKYAAAAIADVASGDIQAGGIYDVVYEAGADAFIVLNALGLDADLTAIAGLSSNGMIARTGAGTAAARTITGTAPVAVTNGDGASGNPTIALGSITSIQTTITDSDTAIPTSGAVVDYVPVGIAALAVGAVGTYALLQQTTLTTARAAGDTLAGSSLEYANANAGQGVSPSGTWRLMGQIPSSSGLPANTSVWLRIS